jgi:hypothetical protein
MGRSGTTNTSMRYLPTPLQSILGLLCALLTLAAWTIASPIGSSPDDNFHLPSIWCGRGAVDKQCAFSPEDGSALVPKPIQRAITCYAFNVTQSAACQSITRDWGKQQFATAPWNNATARIYPPGFYFVMSFFVQKDAQHSIIIMRSVNVALTIILLGGLIVLARNSAIELATLFTPLVISVPLGLFIITSNNPSSWTILGVSAYWGYLYLICTKPTGVRRGLLWLGALVSSLLAICSRVDGSVYILLATGVTLLMHTSSLRDLIRIGRQWALVSLLIPVSALAMYSFLYLGQGVKVAQSGLTQGETPVRTLDQLIFNNLIYLPSLWNGVFGSWGLGWLDTPLSPAVPITVCSIAFYLIVCGLQSADTRRATSFWIVFIALTILPLYVLTLAGHYVGETVQPRYILPMIYLAMGIALTRDRTAQPLSISPMTLYVLMLLLSLAHSIALHQNIRRYVTGTEVVDINLDRDSEWWWWWQTEPTPLDTWIVGSVSFTILALVVASRAVRVNCRRTDDYRVR